MKWITGWLGGGGERVETVALFGEAKLVRTGEGRMELRGGSKEDEARAREWIALFMHEAVPHSVPRGSRP